MKAPREIFLIECIKSGQSSYFWDNWENYDASEDYKDHRSYSYIRKDIYDEAQARIKELEEALRFYTDKRVDALTQLVCGSIVKVTLREHLYNGDMVPFGTTARKALEKKLERYKQQERMSTWQEEH